MHICPVEICAFLSMLPFVGMILRIIKPCCKEWLEVLHRHWHRHDDPKHLNK